MTTNPTPAAPASSVRANLAQIALLETHTGAKWRVGSSPPVSDGEKMSAEDAKENSLIRILRIFLVDDKYEVYAFPSPGSKLAGMGTAILYTLSPFAVKMTMSFAPIVDLMEMMTETEEDLTSGEDADETEETEEEGAVDKSVNEGGLTPASPAALAAAQAAINGTGA